MSDFSVKKWKGWHWRKYITSLQEQSRSIEWILYCVYESLPRSLTSLVSVHRCFWLFDESFEKQTSLVAQMVRNACNVGDRGSIPGLGRSPWRRKMATPCSILAWKIPWIEEPGGLWGWQIFGQDLTKQQQQHQQHGFYSKWIQIKISSGRREM